VRRSRDAKDGEDGGHRCGWRWRGDGREWIRWKEIRKVKEDKERERIRRKGKEDKKEKKRRVLWIFQSFIHLHSHEKLLCQIFF
jgi:hypothetical protein